MSEPNSVQWFLDKLIEHRIIIVDQTTYGDKVKPKHEILLEQAKAMHKEEIENAFVECWKANMPDGYECKLSANEYYNETYRGNEQ